MVERDDAGEPTGVLREEAAWRFKDRYMTLAASRRPSRIASTYSLSASVM